MNAPNGPTVAERLRRWWFTPPRAGLQRLINPWEYRHIGPFGVTRIAAAASRPARASSAWPTAPTAGPPSSCFSER